MQWDLISSNDLGAARGDATTKSAIQMVRGQSTAIAVRGGQFKFTFNRLVGGRRDGIDVLEIDNGLLRTVVLPTRGMGLWKAWTKQGELGWQSPVEGPVHPNLVPIYDPNGLGWLEGFDELVVRCGLQSNGAPDFDANGKLIYPLHGRIGNLPANRLSVIIDQDTGSLRVVGSVMETRFHFQALRLDVEYQFAVNQPKIDCIDTVTNLRSQPTTMQMLYHINIGSPMLEDGAKVVAALDELAPRDAHAAKSIARWDIYDGPTPGYAEQVYFARPYADSRGWTTTVLQNADQSRAAAVRFDTQTLPYFNLWKNTVADEDGYVTGFEPATGFPNPRGFEENQGRLVSLDAGQSTVFAWQIESLDDATSIERALSEVRALQRSDCKILREPKAGWSNT